MKKTIIASAIAAATFSGAAMAGAHAEKNLPTVYGNIQYVLYHDNIDGGSSAVEHADNGSTLGVLHDHEIAPGLTGFFRLEIDRLGADDISTESTFRIDQAYVGVKGENFGQLWVGTSDTVYERAVTEISEFYEVAFLNQFVNYDTGEGDTVQYLSPNFGGLTIGAAVQINGDGDGQVDKKSYPWQLAAMYEVDALELAFAVDSNDGGRAYDGFNRVDSVNNENTYGLRASYNLDNLRLTGEFHTRKDVADTFGVMGVYTLGKNQFALSYELTQYDNNFVDADLADKDVDTVTLQALHNLSDHMYVYFEGYLGGGDNGVYGVADKSERSVASVGAVYYF
ncbi:porin [Marinobacter sp.]|uniref:porin n=1 Tax=Marinobacter sp. TaxID=50741 RepID=UPI001A05473F|nr:porin [Marinobacter sp.]MBE0487250.1 porin [Marinobacter sp.]